MLPMGSALYSFSPTCRNITAAPETPVSPTRRALSSMAWPLVACVTAVCVMAGGAPLGFTITGGASAALGLGGSSTLTEMGASADPTREGPLPALSQASM